MPGVFESSALEPEAAGEDDESSVEGLGDFEDILVCSLTPTVQTWCLAQALLLISTSYRRLNFDSLPCIMKADVQAHGAWHGACIRLDSSNTGMGVR